MLTARTVTNSIAKTAGFTLIELLVVAAIIMVMMGISIVGYLRFNERQQVEAAAREIQTLLRTAQAKAQVREVPVTGTCNELQGYTVRLNSNPVRTVTLSTRCFNNPVYWHPNIDTYIVPDNININQVFEQAIFIPLKGGARILAYGNTVLPEAEIRVSNSSGTVTYAFTVNSAGVISEGGFE